MNSTDSDGDYPHGEDLKNTHRVHDRASLAAAERKVRALLIKQQQMTGVTLKDEAGTYLSAGVKIGRDSVLGVGVQIYGTTTIGRWLSNTAIGHYAPFNQATRCLSPPGNGIMLYSSYGPSI